MGVSTKLGLVVADFSEHMALVWSGADPARPSTARQAGAWQLRALQGTAGIHKL